MNVDRRTATTPGCEKSHSPPNAEYWFPLGSNNRSDGNSCADVQRFFRWSFWTTDGEEMEDSVWVEENLAVSHAMLVWRYSRLLESFFADRPDTRVAYLSVGTWVNHKQHIISRSLLKFDIALTLSLLVETFHFNHAVHGFALVFSMARVGNLRSIFEEGVIVAH